MAEAIDAAGRANVRAAIAAAEAKTAGEIFVVVAEESDDYRSVPFLWAILGALVLPAPLIFLTALPASLIYLLQLALFAALAIVLSLPPIHMAVVPRRAKREAARALAAEQFLAHGLSNTEARTGVLIFVSLREHHAELIADTGIAAKVDAAVWDGAMAKLIAEIRAGRLADGLTAAIADCGAVLAAHFPPAPRDVNELSDDLVLL
jgi:putative membrane protein